ncbi:MAG: hypothetical protein A3I88_01400 [Candidatus Portnoybacteria bacterium RIFCSPLOWO2_12_FULL_39_9]|uniref:Uncharacterized protein n=1 Tax=Candidatus Portnoybacteria bacterium RIFCSPHIGHO2_12_FULL_38_9 TaxID=1801997 RepID=A0A1G2FIQ5_9BACT|nr:MAG: hypothetical protein A3H00_01415 [Candidatus Portnoybacteria bacterium RBG_13_40_8]OGZ37530.1 MAG: hypothetical protein A3J64_00885 [Candidatus Portnoybacteria bacterium RIFCSPHIGHO2_12_FULL_38_9]OGZ39350.1 MAG: hypothetical protein A3F21_02705 [Candidatus Portnoybacteria bacterium RIFCSPLOWO2_01_FULL_38_39]OGZ39870.1 MAG: hypothetical protein A3I88_01400 [Candidatus Portnoybacteria bacterium RIFCSPLOWO2_12_FULL_39_9]
MSHEHYSVEEGETREDRKRRYRKQAENQLYDEGEIGFCGSNEAFRRREEKINKRVQEIKEREE